MKVPGAVDVPTRIPGCTALMTACKLVNSLALVNSERLRANGFARLLSLSYHRIGDLVYLRGRNDFSRPPRINLALPFQTLQGWRYLHLLYQRQSTHIFYQLMCHR